MTLRLVRDYCDDTTLSKMPRSALRREMHFYIRQLGLNKSSVMKACQDQDLIMWEYSYQNFITDNFVYFHDLFDHFSLGKTAEKDVDFYNILLMLAYLRLCFLSNNELATNAANILAHFEASGGVVLKALIDDYLARILQHGGPLPSVPPLGAETCLASNELPNGNIAESIYRVLGK